MRRTTLFAIAAAAQALFALASLLVVRWGFRSWPQGAYVVLPLAIMVAQLGLLAVIGRVLGARGLSFGLLVAAWYVGRIAGAALSALVPGVGLGAALLDAATFGAVAPGGPVFGGRLALGPPSLTAIVLPVAVLWLSSAAHRLPFAAPQRPTAPQRPLAARRRPTAPQRPLATRRRPTAPQRSTAARRRSSTGRTPPRDGDRTG